MNELTLHLFQKCAAANGKLALVSHLVQLGANDRNIRRWVSQGKLHEVAPGVIALPGADVSHPVQALATALATEGFVDGMAALWFYRIVAECPPIFDVCVGRTSSRHVQAADRSIRLHRPIALNPETTPIDGVQVASVETALCRACCDNEQAVIARLMLGAVRRGVTSIDKLATFADQHPRVAGMAQFRRCVAEFPTTASAFEKRFASILEQADIRGWKQEHRVRLDGASYYIDFAWIDLKIAIELDGRAYHDDDAAFEKDRKRQNALVLAGWMVLRFTWSQLTTDSAAVLKQVRATLTSRML